MGTLTPEELIKLCGAAEGSGPDAARALVKLHRLGFFTPARARSYAALELHNAKLREALEAQHVFLCYITEENIGARNDEELLVEMGDKLREALATTGGSA